MAVENIFLQKTGFAYWLKLIVIGAVYNYMSVRHHSGVCSGGLIFPSTKRYKGVYGSRLCVKVKFP